jgi:hypothetical protein
MRSHARSLRRCGGTPLIPREFKINSAIQLLVRDFSSKSRSFLIISQRNCFERRKRDRPDGSPALSHFDAKAPLRLSGSGKSGAERELPKGRLRTGGTGVNRFARKAGNGFDHQENNGIGGTETGREAVRESGGRQARNH